MATPSYRVIDNKKYMWDGAIYETEAEARRVADTYRQSRFDVQLMEEGGAFLLFTRREAAAQ